MNTVSQSTLKAVDFFCGAGGMTNGFLKANIPVIAGIDNDPQCKETYELNNPGARFICSDIKDLTFKYLEDEASINKNNDDLIFIGCSPCQYWSMIKTDKTKSEKSKNLLIDFERFVSYFRPGYIVIENVPGFFTRLPESPLRSFLTYLDDEEYVFDYDVINASHYGVPQSRKRFLLIATRVKQKISIPKPDTASNPPTVKDFIGFDKGFPVVSAGYRDDSDFMHTVAGLSNANMMRLKMTPKNGGNRMSWKDTDLQISAYYGKDESFRDVYGRMYWDKPAPTITTKFHSVTNGRFAHPDQNRGISLREGATLQTFEGDYKFKSTSIASVARLIGNAVPPALSKRIAEHLKKVQKLEV